MKPVVSILGGGPCGLGAAWRLNEIGQTNWFLFEKEAQWGGLSTSFRDAKGYTWDVGGHVLFSHYEYFDKVLDQIISTQDGWLKHERESWIRIQRRWVPYPFQMNIRHVDAEAFLKCIKGIIALYRDPCNAAPENFDQWIEAKFGQGLAALFMRPYNWKVWGYPLDRMSWNWVGERVAGVDLERIIENYVYCRDDVSWGPNNSFRFPRYGGTGSIWTTLASALSREKMHLQEEVVKIDLDKRKIHTRSGTEVRYDYLISSMTLPQLCKISNVAGTFPRVRDLAASSTHVVGMGIRGKPSEELRTKCWMYFPEDNCPFYRVTHFSHYSPNNVPDIDVSWSLMAEVSETVFKRVHKDDIVRHVVQGCVNADLLTDPSQIDGVWYRHFHDTYPIPTIERDEVVVPILDFFENKGVFSRGRMGAWKYEVGNMDHSFMQGKECVDRILHGTEEITLNHPHVVNAPRKQGRET